MSTTTEVKPSPPVVADIIDLCQSDDEKSRDLSPFRKRIKTKFGAVRVKTEGATIKTENVARFPTAFNDSDDDDIEVVEYQPAFTNAKTTGEDDGDVEIVGFIGDRLPHMRCHCPDNPFVDSTTYSTFDDAIASEENLPFCDLCYCYVCDKPAAECEEWTSHCAASDKGRYAIIWKTLREGKKKSSSDSLCSFELWDAELWDSLTMYDQPSHTISPTQPRGPFHPDYEDFDDNKLTKCQKCGWYSDLTKKSDGAPSCSDWCHKCGRIANAELLCNFKNAQYVKEQTDVLVGRKMISFTMHAHDPRQIDAYKKSWEENPDWQYNEAEMQQDAFRHRFGKYVLPGHIVQSVSVVEQIPLNGKFEARRNDELDGELIPLKHPLKKDITALSISETEGVVLDDSSDLALFRELSTYDTFGVEKSMSTRAIVKGDIESAWNNDTQKGIFTVTLYLRPDRSGSDSSISLAKLLGAWYGVFPFPVTSLGRGLTATGFSSIGDRIPSDGKIIPVPPFILGNHEQKTHLKEMKKEIEQKVSLFENDVKKSRSKLTLVSSSGKHFMGGTASNSIVNFKSFLQNYFSEMFVEDVALAELGVRGTWLAKKFGAKSCHRDLKCTGTNGHLTFLDALIRLRRSPSHFTSYVEPDDYPLIVENLYTDATTLVDRLRNISSLVQHLENLGHDAIPYVEGLSVELLPFQKQSVQWALDREHFGIQSFLWTELPGVEDNNVRKLYMNPLLNSVSTVKPKMVRGGLLCEEMGLGKTIISLALILANPAPLLPESGSKVPDEFEEHQGEGPGWDPNLRESLISNLSDASDMKKDDIPPPPTKRGSILSRGTLVVCHVSLVGQWCEEARSKLKDSGLVYPYHGNSRIRNPHVLAKNGIVVTTYATLSSDAFFHAKGRDDEYCAPCEQIRWWRIICDESHTLRSSSTKQSKAVMALVADHKWAVTGTPVNTTLNDIHNQLKFIGIEHLNTYFQNFRRTVFKLVSDPALAKRDAGTSNNDNRRFGHFVFFMRNVMIRHTKTQKYQGTNTDLMALPAKTERTVTITLTPEEREEYIRLELEARKFYTDFKSKARKELSKYYLALSSGLKAMRCACSGGRYPLIKFISPLKESTDMNAADCDSENEEEDPTTKRKKVEEVKYSDFVFTSKLRILIDELTRIRDEDPGSKSLIFSNFSSTLKWLQEELPKHGFDFRLIHGQMPQRQRAEALASFQNDPPTTVFLLSMRSSNCGINLTSANRVFLLEPALNPAAVQQAIGRVHRLGQKRPVEIIRMITEASIETKLTAMLESKYGTSSVKTTDVPVSDVAGNTNDNRNAIETFVGSLSTDKATVLAREFDMLYGADSIEESDDDDEENDDMDYL